MMKNTPTAFAYFITIRTYATWLHGDERGSTDRSHNIIYTPKIPASDELCNTMRLAATETEFTLNASMRETVLQSILNTCNYFHWKMFAAHVRMNHAHFVLQSDISKENTMGKLKHYATKALKNHHRELSARSKFWTRHASTINIWAPESLFPALYYVVKGQGEPMALYYNKQYYDPLDEALYECYRDD